MVKSPAGASFVAIQTVRAVNVALSYTRGKSNALAMGQSSRAAVLAMGILDNMNKFAGLVIPFLILEA